LSHYQLSIVERLAFFFTCCEKQKHRDAKAPQGDQGARIVTVSSLILSVALPWWLRMIVLPAAYLSHEVNVVAGNVGELASSQVTRTKAKLSHNSFVKQLGKNTYVADKLIPLCIPEDWESRCQLLNDD